MDGNDKLRTFGFYVDGCIDGFIRKIIWLHVANTHKDPAVIAYYFLKEVKVINGTATKIRADLGSENSYVYGIQSSFGETVMMNFLAIEAFNTVNQPQTKAMSPGGQYRSIWTILKIFGIVGNMMILTMVMLKH